MRERADAHLNEEAVEAEEIVLVNDLRGDLVGRSDEVRAKGAPLGVELLAARRRPATLAPDLRHEVRVRRVRVIGRLPRVVLDEPVRVDAGS